jgi:hypothetical protein
MNERSLRYMLLGFQLILAGGFILLAFSSNSFIGCIGLIVIVLGLLTGFIGFGITGAK